MREIVKDKMIQLGHNKWVRSDIIVAVEPLSKRTFVGTDIHGNKLRSRVLINHAEGEILASRTAETILKSMTKQDEPIGNLNDVGKAMHKDCTFSNNFDTSLKKNPLVPPDTMSEEDHIVHSLVHCSTVSAAIDMSPFGRSKFYRLLRKHNFDVKELLAFTDDPDMLKDQDDDDGLV